jgi:hypothetical protein
VRGQRGRYPLLADEDLISLVGDGDAQAGADVFMDREEQEDEHMDYERFLCASGEAFVYAAMIRLMMRRFVRV